MVEEHTEETIEVVVEQTIKAFRSEVPPEVSDTNHNSKEMRYASPENVLAPDQTQSSGVKSPETHNETPSDQPHEDNSSDIPFSNMSYKEFE